MSYATRSRTGVLGLLTARTAAVPPGTGTSEDLFSITGQVLVTGFYGLVTVAVPAASIDFDLALDPDDGGADVALATLLAVDSLASGTWLCLNPTAGGALVSGVDVGANLALANPIPMVAGDIKLNVAGGGAIGATCRVSWGVLWVPLSTDGSVVAV
jgi:hypothetical protein